MLSTLGERQSLPAEGRNAKYPLSQPPLHCWHVAGASAVRALLVWVCEALLLWFWFTALPSIGSESLCVTSIHSLSPGLTWSSFTLMWPRTLAAFNWRLTRGCEEAGVEWLRICDDAPPSGTLLQEQDLYLGTSVFL